MTAASVSVEFATRRTGLRQALVSGWAVLACVLVAADAPAGIRAPVMIVFLCIVPGTALVGLLKPDSFAMELALAIALSVAISGSVAGVLAYAHLWSPTAAVLIVAAISIAGALRDIGLGRRARHTGPQILRLQRALLDGAWNGARASLPAPSTAVAKLSRPAPAGQTPGSAAAPEPADRRLGRIASVYPLHPATHRPPPEPVAPSSEATSPLQGFLLDELRRRTIPQGSGRLRTPHSLAHLEPHELADLLSSSSLQRSVAQRAIQEVKSELWFLDDLEQLLRRQGRPSRREQPGPARPPAPRGAWITGLSARKSVPIAWRVLEEDGKSKEWRTRLALEMIDSVPEPGLGEAVVAAGTAYGSLSGFRRGLEARGLPYLLRVDPVTAACELAPDKPRRSAAEAREVVGKRIAGGAGVAVRAQSNGARAEPELVVVLGIEHLLLCEIAATGRPSVFWLSNLPTVTSPQRLASLVRLGNRSRVERASRDLLLGALEVHSGDGAALEHDLSRLALAQGLRTLDLSTGQTEEEVGA
jgi:hypothetical protein